jgi:hypothetical protein
VRLQRGSIRGDVVRDELAEERPASGFGSERCFIVVHVAAVAQSARAPERKEEWLVSGERR